jgi:hypothetical protein
MNEPESLSFPDLAKESANVGEQELKESSMGAPTDWPIDEKRGANAPGNSNKWDGSKKALHRR